ncbi:MAG: GNAT family N-acetyltransferase [Aliifodinibius sp.]|nr:GNAT family N-acetyltransferase [Fodinibius sp.]NIY26957.1 GNAT family N-acetyltransferase [Fodinibius sp.]
MIFSIEKVENVWNDLLPNLYIYFLETEMHRQGKFKPSLERYKQYQDIGAFVLFTARANHKLVGHCGMYITPSMYTDELIAVEDGFFVLKGYRQENTPLQAYRYIERELRKKGVRQISITTHLNIERLMAKLGYKKFGSRFNKYLEN